VDSDPETSFALIIDRINFLIASQACEVFDRDVPEDPAQNSGRMAEYKW
jgi:hypothetical protein